MKSVFKNYQTTIYMAIAFIVWLFCFRSFLSGEMQFFSDAISYADHTRFYLSNIKAGSYPMWNPVWNGGAANDFFLMRIGAFNPFTFVPLILMFVGLDFMPAYITGLIVYFFVGMIGFYLLSQALLNDRRVSYVAFLLLLFSTLSTRMVDSYMLLITIPLIWFFFFLVKLFQTKERAYFLGLVFSASTLLTTYIPFFFITIMMFFILSIMIVYPDKLKSFALTISKFIRRYPITFFIGVAVVGTSLMPGVFFFKDSKSAGVVLSHRNSDVSDTSHVLGVSAKKTSWAIAEDLLFSTFFLENGRMNLAIVYIPVFVFVILGLALFTSANRRLLLYLIWGMALLMMSMPYANGFYDFLRQNIFFFKYFRNLHFFLWFILLPMFVLFAAEQLKAVLTMHFSNTKDRYLMIAWVIVVHVVVAGFLIAKQGEMATSLVVVGLSFLFFLNHFGRFISRKSNLILGALFLIVAIQPVELYHYLFQNAKRLDMGKFNYFDNSFTKFSYTSGELIALPSKENKRELGSSRYYAQGHYNYIFTNMDYRVVQNYEYYTFYVYNQWQEIKDEDLNLLDLEQALATRKNLLYLSSDQTKPAVSGNAIYKLAQPITKDSNVFTVLDYSVNHVTVKTNFNTQQAIGFVDNYHPSWKATVNGKPIKVYRANMAFKGVVVPSGERIITFKFDAGSRMWVRLLLILMHFGVLSFAIYFWTKER